MKFKPTKEMIEAAESVFVAMAWIETVKPIVEAYQKKALLEIGLYCKRTGEQITDIKLAYMSDNEEKSNEYYNLLEKYQIESGLTVPKPGMCPLLVANSLKIDAERELVNILEPITGINYNKLTYSLNNFKKGIDLMLKMMAYFVDSDKVVSKYKAA